MLGARSPAYIWVNGVEVIKMCGTSALFCTSTPETYIIGHTLSRRAST